MTFNVENLFDTQDDPAKDDQTFLPLSQKNTEKHRRDCARIRRKSWRKQCLELDWSEEVLKTKLSRLAAVVRSVNGGRGPDLLILQEVENRGVLERLRNEYLADLGYLPSILIEGNDLRGIDVGMISRLPVMGEAVLHPARLESATRAQREDSRGILQATFRLPDGTPLTAFGLHLPAPFHPVKLRKQMLRRLQELRDRLPSSHQVVVGGDFNIPIAEDEKEGLTKQLRERGWIVAHQAGCENCLGTSYYPPLKAWSFLDMLLLSKDFAEGSGGWTFVPGSVRIENRVPEHRTSEGFPAEFVAPASGISDHWPLALEIQERVSASAE